MEPTKRPITNKERKERLRKEWGDRIRIDELCTCGHLRSEHGEDAIISDETLGHGSCKAVLKTVQGVRLRPCTCRRFRWARTIFSPRVRREHGRRGSRVVIKVRRGMAFIWEKPVGVSVTIMDYDSTDSRRPSVETLGEDAEARDGVYSRSAG